MRERPVVQIGPRSYLIDSLRVVAYFQKNKNSRWEGAESLNRFVEKPTDQVQRLETSS
jgi:hypothetical protein